MKRVFGVALLAFGISSPVWADSDSGLYLGLSGGTDQIDAQGVDNASGAGLLAGWRFNKNVAMELSGFSSDADANDILPGCVFEIDTVALYLAGRSTGQAYVKGRIGALSETVTPRDTCSAVPEDTQSGLSLGFGGGVNIGKAALELEYTLVDSDVNRLSLTVLYNF